MTVAIRKLTNDPSLYWYVFPPSLETLKMLVQIFEDLNAWHDYPVWEETPYEEQLPCEYHVPFDAGLGAIVFAREDRVDCLLIKSVPETEKIHQMILERCQFAQSESSN